VYFPRAGSGGRLDDRGIMKGTAVLRSVRGRRMYSRRRRVLSKRQAMPRTYNLLSLLRVLTGDRKGLHYLQDRTASRGLGGRGPEAGPLQPFAPGIARRIGGHDIPGRVVIDTTPRRTSNRPMSWRDAKRGCGRRASPKSGLESFCKKSTCGTGAFHVVVAGWRTAGKKDPR